MKQPYDLSNHEQRAILALHASEYGITLPDCIDNILSLDDVTKDGMFAVQPGCFGVGNKKLASVGPRTGIRH